MWSRIGELDQRLFDQVAATRLPGLDRALPELSRAANYSMLWFGIAGGLAATRQVRLRRAALRGVAGIAIASPVANVLGKQLFRRARPGIDRVPPIRVRYRVPASSAFPSGHAASAAAFTAGVALEAPKAVAIPIAALGVTVAASRVYTGVHYPGDVLAGVALGVAVAAVTRALSG